MYQGQDGNFSAGVPGNSVFSGPQPVASGGMITSSQGDIALQPAQKKSKKWLFLVFGVLLVVAAIGVVVAIMMLRGRGGDDTDINGDYRETFNIYANYMLYGEDSNAEIEDFDPKWEFYIDENYEDANYAKNLLDKYDNFEKSITSSEEGKAIIEAVGYRDIKDNLEFLVAYSEFERIGEKNIMEIYESKGADAANQYVEKYYENNKNGGERMDRIRNQEILYKKAMVDYLMTGVWSYDGENVEMATGELLYIVLNSVKLKCKEIALALGEIE